jgi:hypothetical protein
MSRAALHEAAMDRMTQVFNSTVLVAAHAVVLWMVTGKQITRPAGAALLTFYGAYPVAVMVLAA